MWAVAAWSWCVLVLGGAATAQTPVWHAEVGTPFLEVGEGSWPARVTRGGRLGVLIEEAGPIAGWTQVWSWRSAGTVNEEDRGHAAAWNAGRGEGEAEVLVSFEGRGGYVVSFREDGRVFFSQRPREPDRPAFGLVYLSAEEEPGGGPARGKSAGGGRVVLQRTSMVVYDPLRIPPPGSGAYVEVGEEEWRGLAVVLPGMFGTPDTVVDALVRRLRDRGWVVLRVLSPSSRFTETVEFVIDVRRDLREQAAEVSRVLSTRAAEVAYAVEAGVAKVMERRSSLAGLPRVIVGMSAGAMTLPTVVARDPGTYAAAVVVGGGADWWLINERSNYRSGVDAIRVKWVGGGAGGEVGEAERRAFDEAYLASSPLDPFHTASVLRGKPVYVFQGTLDRAVQSELGDVLWERLGRPHRVTVPYGHELMFGSFATRVTEVVGWLGERTARGVDGGPSAGGRSGGGSGERDGR